VRTAGRQKARRLLAVTRGYSNCESALVPFLCLWPYLLQVHAKPLAVVDIELFVGTGQWVIGATDDAD